MDSESSYSVLGSLSNIASSDHGHLSTSSCTAESIDETLSDNSAPCLSSSSSSMESLTDLESSCSSLISDEFEDTDSEDDEVNEEPTENESTQNISFDQIHLSSPLYDGADVTVLDSIILLYQFLLR